MNNKSQAGQTAISETVGQQLVQQEVQSRQCLNLEREKVLTRLWEIANLSPEQTRGSITGQVKAISMIVAIQGLLPGRNANSSAKKPASAPQIHTAAWPANQQATRIDPQPSPAQRKEVLAQSAPAAGSAKEAPSNPARARSTIADLLRRPEILPPSYDSFLECIPYASLPFTIDRNPFVHSR